MKAFFLHFVLTLSLKWLEYRFNRDYGNYFFDYSLNGRFGINGNSSSTSKVLCTDRGIYLQHTTSFVKINTTGPFLSQFTVSAWVISKDKTISIFYYKSSSFSIIFGRGDGEDRIRLYLNSTVNFADQKDFLPGLWILVTLVYSDSSFKAYSNEKLSLTVPVSFSPADDYEIGIGYLPNYKALECIIWNLQIYDGYVDYTSLITTDGLTNCFKNQVSCLPCSVAFNDPDLKTGCLTVNFNTSINAYGNKCSVIGCTKTVSLSCSNFNSICTYDQTTNTCYEKSLLDDLTVLPNSIAPCKCEAGYINREQKCCPEICSSCDYLGVCTGCYSKNASYSNGQCSCDDGFLSTGNFSILENCFRCEEGCSNCTLNQCISCSDSNAAPQGKYCQCNDMFYGSPSSCQQCRESCSKCSAFDECSECVNENAEIVDGLCACKQGYFGNGSVCENCDISCKSCTSFNNCIECSDQEAIIVEGVCRCNLGFFNQNSDNAISCLPCHENCKTCSNSNDCITCKEGKGELNSSNSCILLCWNTNITEKNCTKCPELCIECNTDLNCTKCAPNSKIINEKCECKKGFINQNNSCTVKFFHAKFNVSKTNKLQLKFSETLEKRLSFSDFLIKVDGIEVDFSLTQKGNESCIINPKVKLKIDQERLVVLLIKSDIFSVSGSILNNTNFESILNYIPEEISFFGVSVGQTVTIIISTTIAASLSSNPSVLWSLLNTIQLLIFMPLNSIEYPEKLKKMSQSLLDYNPIKNIFEIFIDSNSTSLPYSNALEFGITSSVLLLNIGSMLTIFIISVIFLLLLTFVVKYIFPSWEKLKKIQEEFKSGFFIMFWIQSYLEIGIFSIIQLKSKIMINGVGHFNMFFALLLAVIIKKIFFVISPGIFFYILKYSEKSADEEEFQSKFGKLIEDLDYKKNWIISFYYPLFMIRRLEYVLAQIFLIDHPSVAVLINIGFSLGILIFLIYFRPFKDFSTFASALISEVCVNAVFISSCLFIFVTDEEDIKRIETVCVYFIFATVSIQLIFGLLNFFKAIKMLYLKLEKSRALHFASTAIRECQFNEYLRK